MTARLVLVQGPIAVGKSALARALTARLRRDGARVALVELDQIAEMALPTLPDWADAHRIFCSVVAQWLGTPPDVVVAEGVGSPEEAAALHAAVADARGAPPDGEPTLSVVLTVAYATALERALADPTRGISRDPAFLRREYDRWDRVREEMPADLRLDTSAATLEECVEAVLGRLGGRLEPA